MSKKKEVEDADRDVLDWVVVLHNPGYVAHIEHLTYDQGQSILQSVQYGKGLRFSHLQRTYRPGYVDWAQIMTQVEWDAMGEPVDRP